MKTLKRLLSMMFVFTMLIAQANTVYASAVNEQTIGGGKYWFSEDEGYIIPKGEEAAISFDLDGFDEVEELEGGFLIELIHTELPVTVEIPVVALNDFTAFADVLPSGGYKWAGLKSISNEFQYFDVKVVASDVFELKPGITSEFTVYTRDKYAEEVGYGEDDAATVIDDTEDEVSDETQEEEQAKEAEDKKSRKAMILFLYIPLGILISGFAYLLWRRNQW